MKIKGKTWKSDFPPVPSRLPPTNDQDDDDDGVSKWRVCAHKWTDKWITAAGQIKASTQKKWKNSIDCLFFIRTLKDTRSRRRKNLLSQPAVTRKWRVRSNRVRSKSNCFPTVVQRAIIEVKRQPAADISRSGGPCRLDCAGATEKN